MGWHQLGGLLGAALMAAGWGWAGISPSSHAPPSTYQPQGLASGAAAAPSPEFTEAERARARHSQWAQSHRIRLDAEQQFLLWHAGDWWTLDRKQNQLIAYMPLEAKEHTRIDLGGATSDVARLFSQQEKLFILYADTTLLEIDPQSRSSRALKLHLPADVQHRHIQHLWLTSERVHMFGSRVITSIVNKKRQHQRDGLVLSFDKSSGALLKQGVVGQNVSHPTVVDGIAYFRDHDHAYAYDLERARVVWRFKSKSHFRGIVASRDAVFVQEDQRLNKLATATGRVLKQRSIQSHGNQGPRLHDGMLLLASNGLLVLDSDLRTLEHFEEEAWFMDHGVVGPYVFARSQQVLRLYERQPLRPLARLPLEGEWYFPGDPVWVDDKIVARASRSHNSTRLDELRWFEPLRADEVDVSQLPSGSEIYHNAQRLTQRPLVLPLGNQQLDVLMPGQQLATLNHRVVPGTTTHLVPPTATPAPPTRPWTTWHELPEALKPTRLIQLKPQKRPTFGGGLLLDGDRWFSWARQGLRAEHWISGKQYWQLERDELLGHLNPGPEVPLQSHRFREHVMGILPHAGLVLVSGQRSAINAIAAFDMQNGTHRWTSFQHELITDRDLPAEHLGMVWYPNNQYLHARSLADGHLAMRLMAGRTDYGVRNPIFERGVVYYLYGERLVAQRLADQKVLWTLAAKRAPKRPVLYSEPHSDALLLIENGSLRRISKQGRVLAARGGLARSIIDIEPLQTPDTLYLCGHQSNLSYALDATSLDLRWQYRERLKKSPCATLVSEDEVLLTDGRYAVALAKNSGRVLAQNTDFEVGFVKTLASSASELCLLGRGSRYCVRR